MGFVSNLLGGGGGAFNAQSAPIMQGVNTNQTGAAYDQSQNALAQQQAFLQALQGQNGIGNQSSVFNQLQGVASGTGPNPALAQLNNTTGQNIASQAALMAGQRGAGANAGLLARQAAQQGGALQQQAVGQGAALQANQQLNALGQLGGIAGQQVGQQSNALTGLNQFGQNEQSNLLGALGQYNNASVSNASQQNSANAAVQSKVAGGQQGLLGGALGGLGTALIPGVGPALAGANVLGSVMKAEGGPVSMAGQHLKMSKGGATSGMIPGKAEVKGDSLKNDKVPIIASPGEFMIKRTVMQSKDPKIQAALDIIKKAHGG